MLFREDELVFEVVGAAVGVEARGTWAGQARFDPHRIFGLIRHLPQSGSVEIHRQGDRIFFDSFSFRCSWDPEPLDALKLPMDPTETQLLWASQVASRTELARAGILPLVERAEEDLEASVRVAHEALRPYGVSRVDLMKLIRRSISARHA